VSHSKSCSPVTIARSRAAHVQHCEECGCVSIHLGHASIRLDEASALELTKALVEAAVFFRDPAAFPPPVACTPRGRPPS
jgi:hypothetical protein